MTQKWTSEPRIYDQVTLYHFPTPLPGVHFVLRPYPGEPVGLPCPECGERPLVRQENGKWACLGMAGKKVQGEFTLADVLRYLWKPKS